MGGSTPATAKSCANASEIKAGLALLVLFEATELAVAEDVKDGTDAETAKAGVEPEQRA